MTTDVKSSHVWSPSTSYDWWTAYHGRISPGYLELIAAESNASRIIHFHPIFIPGLLQTREYALAITPATTLGGMRENEVDAYVQVRMRRQRELFDAETASFVFLIDETALRRPVGRIDTMVGQLDHLQRVMNRRNVTVAVLPQDSPPHPGLLGAFMLCQYSDPRIGDALCFDGPSGNMVIRGRPDLTAGYGRLADRLARAGLVGARAAASIRSARGDLERGP